jgi:hypothetical protein
MRNKWFRRIKRFIEIFTPGGTGYTEYGTEYHVSWDGSITTPESEMQKVRDKVLGDMKKEIALSREAQSKRN